MDEQKNSRTISMRCIFNKLAEAGNEISEAEDSVFYAAHPMPEDQELKHQWFSEMQKIGAFEERNDRVSARFREYVCKTIEEHSLDITADELIKMHTKRIWKHPFDNARKELEEEGITFVPIDDLSHIKQLWHDTFTRGTDAKTLKDIQYYQVRWHIFNYNIYDSFSGKEARQAFDKAEKREVYLFFHNGNDGYLLKNAHLLTSYDLGWTNDAIHYDSYLFDPKSGWTYVRDHEHFYYFATT